jgi:DNA-binding NtrC family response regulator
MNGADSAPLEAARILVVDDEVVTRTLVTIVLAQEGYQVAAAENGRKAIALLERRPYDLVITDLEMPGANGIEVLFAVRRIDPQCPVIIITGSTDTGSVARHVNLDAVDYVTKPFSFDQIRGTVSRMLQKRKT